MDYSEVAGKLRVLGHPDRLRILDCLKDCADPVSVDALAAALSMRQSTLSQHLHALRKAGLVAFEEEGESAFKVHRYRLCFPELPRQLPALVGA
jgi:DNA-binding transcriptional ArsR family regulator